MSRPLLPRNRTQAALVGSTRYFTGEPCKHGHHAERVTKSGTCTACQRKWARLDRERICRLLDAAARGRR